MRQRVARFFESQWMDRFPVPPAPTALTPPVVPDVPLSEILSFQNDPDFSGGT